MLNSQQDIINRLQEQTAATLAKFADRISTLKKKKYALNLTLNFTFKLVFFLLANKPKKLKFRLINLRLYKKKNIALYFQFKELLRAKLQINKTCIGEKTKQV